MSIKGQEYAARAALAEAAAIEELDPEMAVAQRRIAASYAELAKMAGREKYSSWRTALAVA